MAKRNRDTEKEEVKPAGITTGKLVMILIPVCCCQLLRLAAYLLLMSNMAPASAEAEAEALDAIENPDPIYIQVGKILVNVDYQGDIRYIQGDVQLMFHHQESADIAERDMPVIINELNTLFARQAFGEMRSVEGKEKLRRASLARLTGCLSSRTDLACKTSISPALICSNPGVLSRV